MRQSTYSLVDMEMPIAKAAKWNEVSGAGDESPNGKTSPKVKENTGRWLAEEHQVFLKGLNEHGKQWKKIAVMIQTRSVVQVRTHAQKYFQKLLKNEKKEQGDISLGKDRSSSISLSTTAPAVKRKSSIKGNKSMAVAAVKKRRVSLEPKPKKQSLPRMVSTVHHHENFPYHHHPPPHLMASAPPIVSPAVNPTVIGPSSFMNNLAEGELDDSLLDLLVDDSSVEAVEQVIGGSDDDYDLEPNKVETVSPAVSSVSLAETVEPTPAAQVMAHNRHEMVTSPQDFSVPTMGNVVPSVSPTSVACMVDMQDLEEQKTSNNNYHFVDDALDWLMDVGVHQLPPATANEVEGQ